MYASPIFAHSNPILKQEAGEGSSGPQDLQAAISAPRSPTPKPKQATPRFTKRAKTMEIHHVMTGVIITDN